MASSTAFLSLSSLTPKTLSLSTHKPISLPLQSLSFSSLSISPSLLQSQSTKNFLGLSSSPLVTKVAVSSNFEQDEEVLSSDGGQQSFAPDLKLFVGNLPFTVDSAQLAGLFESAGNVEMVEVIYDKTTGRSRGFGFVTMSTVDEVEAAAQQFNGYELEGRSLRVNYGPPPPRTDEFSSRGGRAGGGGASFNNPNRVHVGNLAWGVDDLALETLFREQGNVVEAKVVYDRDSGRSRGFGFVTYSSAEEVDSAVESLNGVDLNGRAIRVSQAEARQRRQF